MNALVMHPQDVSWARNCSREPNGATVSSGISLVVDDEEALDEFLREEANTVPDVNHHILTEDLHAGLLAQVQLDVDHRSVEALLLVVHKLGWAAAQGARDGLPLVRSQDLE